MKWSVLVCFAVVCVAYAVISKILNDLEATAAQMAATAKGSPSVAVSGGKLRARFKLFQKLLSRLMLGYADFFAAAFLLWAVLELPHHPSISNNITVEGSGYTSINDIRALMIEVLDRFSVGFVLYHLIRLIGRAFTWMWPLSPAAAGSTEQSDPNRPRPPEHEGVASAAVHLSPEAMQWILEQIERVISQIKENTANFSKSLDELKAAFQQRSNRSPRGNGKATTNSPQSGAAPDKDKVVSINAERPKGERSSRGDGR
jgi:hypothetical protein